MKKDTVINLYDELLLNHIENDIKDSLFLNTFNKCADFIAENVDIFSIFELEIISYLHFKYDTDLEENEKLKLADNVSAKTWNTLDDIKICEICKKSDANYNFLGKVLCDNCVDNIKDPCVLDNVCNYNNIRYSIYDVYTPSELGVNVTWR